ncbi:MAG: MFS transporter [Planctomycetaceae bacterium]
MDSLCKSEPPRGAAGDILAGRTRFTVDAGFPAAFWVAYVANVAVVTANALTFRFAELVGYLGGRESTAGVIIAVATAAALFSRVYLGQAIDRYGVRRLWIVSALFFVAGGGLLTISGSLWLLNVARSLFAIGLAGVFTCSNVHVQGLVPAHRRTEAIGTLGSGGFLGMFLGTAVGDAIFHAFDDGLRFAVLFGVATLLGVLHVALVVVVTRRDRHVPPAVTPAVHRLVVHHWPGNVMLVAFVMGLMFAVTTVFLTRFATQQGLSGLGPFFASYAISAFTFRLVSRSWSRTVGRHRMILWGLSGHVATMLILPLVTSEWLFVIPAIFGGFGHALLFPAVISLGSEAFPREYRGTGTTIVMGFIDVGTFVSAPLLGGIIDAFAGNGFTPMFLFAGAAAVVVAIIYQRTAARVPDSDLLPFVSAVQEPAGAAPLAARHSPIEPIARTTIESGSSREDSIVRPAVSAPARQSAAMVPATRCR